MKIQVAYHGLRLQEQIRSLQSAFQDGALGRIVPSPQSTIAVELTDTNEAIVINSLRRAAQNQGFIILQDDENFRDLDIKHYQALTLVH